MHYSKLQETEQLVQEGLNGQYTLDPFSIPIKGEEPQLKGYLIRPICKILLVLRQKL